MRNLKVVRKLRGQSAPGLRKKLTATEKELKKEQLNRQNAERAFDRIMAENYTLRRRIENRKEINIGSGMLDEIMAKFTTELSEELVRRVMQDNPETVRNWTHAVRDAAKTLTGACYRETSSTFCMNDSFALHVWEGADNKDLHFNFKVTNISNHKVLPRHARKAQIMSDPHQRMYLLDEVNEYFAGTGIGDKTVESVGIFR